MKRLRPGLGQTTGVASDHLWRHAEAAHEHLAQMTAIAKAGLPRHRLQRMTGLLDHQTRRLQAQTFNGFGGRLPGFSSEHPAELSRTEVGDLTQLLDAQGAAQVLPGVGERDLNPIWASGSAVLNAKSGRQSGISA